MDVGVGNRPPVKLVRYGGTSTFGGVSVIIIVLSTPYLLGSGVTVIPIRLFLGLRVFLVFFGAAAASVFFFCSFALLRFFCPILFPLFPSFFFSRFLRLPHSLLLSSTQPVPPSAFCLLSFCRLFFSFFLLLSSSSSSTEETDPIDS